MALDFGAGCLGGCAGVLVGHPFDTVKVRLQIQDMHNPIYKGTLDCFVSIIKKESVVGLFKGMKSPLYGLAAINAIVFGVQGNVQRRLNNPDSLTSHFVAGSIAGLSQSFICSPMELAKTRMQMLGVGEKHKRVKRKQKEIKGPVDLLLKIYRKEGLRGVFRGCAVTTFRETPSFGVYFLTYEYLCRTLHQGPDEADVSTPILLFAGGCSGMASWLSTYPLDVVKSRVQADGGKTYDGFWDCARKSYNSEGIRFFGKGLGSTMLRAFPTNAATFGTVTWSLRLMRTETTDDGIYDFREYKYYHQYKDFPSEGKILTIIPNFPSHP